MDLITSENARALEQPAKTSRLRAESPAPPPPSFSAPQTPLVVIKPKKSWTALNLRDLWAYRELLYFLIWRDVKVRYKQTLLGAAWAVIQPLLTTLIFTLFFGVLAGVQSEGIPYPVFAYTGLLPWTFFANAVAQSSNSLVGSSNLITKVYFPRMIIPGAAVGAGLMDLAITFVILLGMMVYYGVAFTWGLLMLPALVVLLTLFSLGVGMWLSALNVKYRDIRYAVPFLIQIWMFLSPVIYPPTIIPPRWRWASSLNPLTGIIDAFRTAVFGHKPFDWVTLGSASLITVTLLVYSAYAFRRMEKSFADLV